MLRNNARTGYYRGNYRVKRNTIGNLTMHRRVYRECELSSIMLIEQIFSLLPLYSITLAAVSYNYINSVIPEFYRCNSH